MKTVNMAFGYGLIVTVCSCIRGDGAVDATTTVYVQHGRTAMLSWTLPKPEIREFTVRHSSGYLFHLTDYNKVSVSDASTLKAVYTGNINASGSGVFAFQLFDAGIWSAGGSYSCYGGSPSSRGRIIPNCGQKLVILHLQDPYIVTKGMVESSRIASLSCYSIIRSSPVSHVMASVTWKRNGVNLTIAGKYQVSIDYGWFSYDSITYNNTLTISKDGTDENVTYSCQVEVKNHLFQSNWSCGYMLNTEHRVDMGTNYTVLSVGDSATVTWKIPRHRHLVHVKSDSGRHMFRQESAAVYVEYYYWPRVTITEVITSSAANVVRFRLYNVTEADAGRYNCDGIPCEYVLVVSRVPAKPRITSSTKPLVGENITLICSSTSRSLPQDHNLTMFYNWRRDNTSLLSGGRHQISGSSLTIREFKRQDMGNYSCQATEEMGLKSEWSNTCVMEGSFKPAILNLSVNGTSTVTVSVNQTVEFMCEVEGYPPPHVYIVHVGSSKAVVNMLRRQEPVYHLLTQVRSCSLFGQYVCRANNTIGTSEGYVATLQTPPRKQDSKDCEIENKRDGKPPSGNIEFTLCAYPAPVVTKWYFAKYGSPRDITANEKYKLARKASTDNLYDYMFTITNITENDFGAYIFRFEHAEATADIIIIASPPKGPSNSSVVIGCSILAIALVVVAIVFLCRVEYIRDYWRIRFPQAFITETNNINVSLENVTEREYDVIEDSHLADSIAISENRRMDSDVDYQKVRTLSLSSESNKDDLECHYDMGNKEQKNETEKGSTSLKNDVNDEEQNECSETEIESVLDIVGGHLSFPLTIADDFNTCLVGTRFTVGETDRLCVELAERNDQEEVMQRPVSATPLDDFVSTNQLINKSDILLSSSAGRQQVTSSVTRNEYEHIRRQALSDEYTSLKPDHNPSDSL
ncbi:uncharacterized protein LOC124286915 [Haliotis rubra]|uniref:uncharacterized protein LOC124286915 n=1 Tax=Haliotis rubra TaxID=36100 RepID=UPI001EE551C3|nr:uncharacterized protein LOC124286915 [Haliotis rubra]